MGQLFNQVLGIPSGKVGTLIFRRRKGANFIAVPPMKRGTLPDAADQMQYAESGRRII